MTDDTTWRIQKVQSGVAQPSERGSCPYHQRLLNVCSCFRFLAQHAAAYQPASARSTLRLRPEWSCILGGSAIVFAMKVTVHLFAGLSELLGQRHVTLDVAEGATVGLLWDQLASEYPRVTPFLPSLVCAIDEEFVPSEHPLRDGDEVAIIPPISGGSDEDEGLFRVTSEPLDQEPLLAAVRRDESGAVALFYGVARNHSHGRPVRALEYDAYPSMAEKKLREVADEVRERWPISGIGVLHRTGRLAIGETSLLVAVSAAHRREAFAACEYAVDRIKQIVPIWKKELWEDGDGDWVAGHTITLPQEARGRPGA